VVGKAEMRRGAQMGPNAPIGHMTYIRGLC